MKFSLFWLLALVNQQYFTLKEKNNFRINLNIPIISAKKIILDLRESLDWI